MSAAPQNLSDVLSVGNDAGGQSISNITSIVVSEEFKISNGDDILFELM